MSSIIKSDTVELGTAFPLLLPEKPALPDLKTILEQDDLPGRNQALQILERAQAEAEEIVAAGKVEVEHIRADMETLMQEKCQQLFEEAFANGQTQGYTEGYDSGYQKGYAEGFQQNEGAAEALRRALEQYEAVWSQTLDENFDDLKYLALEIAEKIICTTLEEDSEIFLRLIEKGLNTFRGFSWVDVYLSTDAPAAATICVEEQLAERLQLDPNYIKVKRKADLKAGDCVVETESGVIDVGLSTQLAQIKDALQGDEDHG